MVFKLKKKTEEKPFKLLSEKSFKIHFGDIKIDITLSGKKEYVDELTIRLTKFLAQEILKLIEKEEIKHST